MATRENSMRRRNNHKNNEKKVKEKKDFKLYGVIQVLGFQLPCSFSKRILSLFMFYVATVSVV